LSLISCVQEVFKLGVLRVIRNKHITSERRPAYDDEDEEDQLDGHVASKGVK